MQLEYQWREITFKKIVAYAKSYMLELQKDLIPIACSDECKIRQGIWSLCMLVWLSSCRTVKHLLDKISQELGSCWLAIYWLIYLGRGTELLIHSFLLCEIEHLFYRHIMKIQWDCTAVLKMWGIHYVHPPQESTT